ncbi:hypothetical protein ABEB36_000743 [Hypothenemus hampei]|uniref:Uncharacterized protein n=1 Tax=Hypothenemus hampei TaxID=57062 RepID=A0ABD1FCC5_HYPHA
MKITFVLLMVLLYNHVLSYPNSRSFNGCGVTCNSDCCSSSSCNDSCCNNNCKIDCCCKSDCCCNSNKCATTGCSEKTEVEESTSNHSSHNENTNNNTIVIPTNINISNEIHSETHISVPVSVITNNENNIHITSSDTVSPTPVTNHTIIYQNHTVQVRVPVPVPIPEPYPVPIQTGCCQVYNPCVPYTQSGCYRIRQSCNNECSSQLMYQPTSICENGCYKRQMSWGNECGAEGCLRKQVDCSGCNNHFGQNFFTFQKCAGCYIPMPWSMGGFGNGYL